MGKIKKLKIYGFKSFYNKAELVFKDGFCAIVGPNGCGKSNIFDALKWVLGEKSTKMLRAENLTDVIFNGSEKYPPLNMAEVEVVLDNTNNLLDIKTSEVSIKRRIYSSGEGEFFINNKKCRLKDIISLLLDTGIGKGAYSFVEQNRVDTLLSTKPEEMRKIFEEAAGIAKYKMKREQTVLNLEETKRNLEKIYPVLKQLEKEKVRLKEQAEKARIYKEKAEAVRDIEIKIKSIEYKKLKNIIASTTEKINKLSKEKENIEKEYDEVEKKYRSIESETSEIQKEMYTLDAKKAEKQAELRSQKNAISIYEKNIQQNNENIKFHNMQVKELFKRNDILLKEHKQKEERLINLEKEIKELENELKPLEEKRNKLLQNKKELQIQEEKTKEEIRQRQRELKELEKELKEATKRFVEEIDKIKKEYIPEINVKESRKKINSLLNKLEICIEKILNGEKETEIKRVLSELKIEVKRLIETPDKLSEILFDENGAYAYKEKISNTIDKIKNEIMANQSKVAIFNIEHQKVVEKLNETDLEIQEKYHKIKGMKEEKKRIMETIEQIKKEIETNNKRVKTHEEEIKKITERNRQISEKIRECDSKIIALQKEVVTLDKQKIKFVESIKKKKNEIRTIEEKFKKLKEKLTKLDRDIMNLKEQLGKAEGNKQIMLEQILEEYEVTEEELNKIETKEDIKTLIKQRNELKEQIKSMGKVNYMAEEEYADVEERYNFYIKQKEDVEKSKERLESLIKKINEEAEKMFKETFDAIKKNYRIMVKKLFGEGAYADIKLVEPEKPLSSEIIINIQPPGKKLKNASLLSGGEKSLASLALLFAIFLVKPSPFYVLDEIDANLDDANVEKLSKVIREFSKTSQFIVISHNVATIMKADYVYGVTMNKGEGISTVVSLKLTSKDKLSSKEIDKFIQQDVA